MSFISELHVWSKVSSVFFVCGSHSVRLVILFGIVGIGSFEIPVILVGDIV